MLESSNDLSSTLYTYTDDGGKFKGVCQDHLENAKPKNEEGSNTKINHVVFVPSTGTKRRLGVVERFNRTFREKYVAYAKLLISRMLYLRFWKSTISLMTTELSKNL